MSLNIAEENEKRRQELIVDHVSKSKTPNDFHWKAAVALGADPDYTPADTGMNWSDIKENAY